MVKKTATANLPTKYGLFKIVVYECPEGEERTVLIKGDIQNPMLVRLHSSCLTGDVFSSLKCDCGEQLKQSMQKIQDNGSGILIYLNQEGRGIGLTNKIKAYALQEAGFDTVQANELLGFSADERDYKDAADILHDLRVNEINLLTNNPDKEKQLIANGIKVIERIPLEVSPNPVNKSYLQTKKNKMSHYLNFI